jgi:hypothetical protein
LAPLDVGAQAAVIALFDRVASLSELWAAAKRAARGKRHRPSVARTLFDLERVVLDLRRQLLDGTWQPGAPGLHEVFDPKRRIIAAAPFVDRIVHQSLCAAIGPLLDRGLIHDTYACRVGLGTHAAVERATGWARHYRYFAHLDVAKFFPTIDHAILLAQIHRDVPCARTVDLCGRIIAAGGAVAGGPRWHMPGDDLFTPVERAAGLPIGNLTSQHFANRYLSPVDHRAKDRLRIRGYLRYMDDMIVLGDDRAEVEDHARAIEEACQRQRLRLHRWEVMPTRAGVSFLGYRILPDCVRVRRTSVARAERRLSEIADAVAEGRAPREAITRSLRATFAHWKHADSWRLRTRTLRRLGLLLGDASGEDGMGPPSREPGEEG